MPIFAAHAVSAELSNGSTHEFTSAGSPSAEICASNAKRSRHVQVDEASSSEASSDEASSSSPRVLATRRAADSSIAAFSRVEAAATDERDESDESALRLPNAVFSSERRNSRPPSEMSTWVSESPEAASACSSSCACSRQYASRASERRRNLASPRMPTPSSSTPMMNSSDASKPRGRAFLERRGASEDSSAKDSSAKDSSALRSAGRSLLITATHTSWRRVVAVGARAGATAR